MRQATVHPRANAPILSLPFLPKPSPYNMRVYQYQPRPHHVERYWRTAADVYNHLICYPSERARIITDICAMEPGQPYIVRIYHPYLPNYVTYSTVEPNSEFLRHLEGFLCHELYQWHLVRGSLSVRLPPYLNLKSTNN